MEDNIVSTSSPLQNDLDTLNEHISKVKTEVGKLVVGQEKTIDLIMAGIFTGGHILLEGVPG
ncbi:MAG TPA: magnesium chelatase, partial [Cyclobacteriaceae bacterium]|nr:magnesium chelatase [Cyclobacteriaceae bacterium]